VTLTVRPTISRLLRFTNDPNPSLCNDARTNCVANPVPEIQVREMESVLQVATGQTVVLGGLMQDESTFNREQVPVVGNIQDIGELFRFRNERVRKTELVIFLRPIVITNPTLESDELRMFQRYLPQVGSGATVKAGTAQ
jgi:general secretion pathway protein D